MDNLITDERLTRLGIVHATTTACWGHMKLARNKRRFFASLHIPPENILYLDQVHKNDVLTVLTEDDSNRYKSSKHAADGWILGLKNHGVAIHTADCVPLFMWDRNGNFVSIAHCGWRNIAKGFPFEMAKSLMSVKGVNRPVSVFMAPHIRKCCFEVGARVAGYFSKTALRKPNGKFCVDLSSEVRYQLISAGVAPVDIKINCECTFCNPKKYFSYRRTRKKLSMMSFVYKKN
jgi:YfiH family protein